MAHKELVLIVLRMGWCDKVDGRRDRDLISSGTAPTRDVPLPLQTCVNWLLACALSAG